MDPLYANYDKRKKTLDENSAPVPQPTPNSMPVFGATAQPQAPVTTPIPAPQPTPVAPAPAPAPAPQPAPAPVTPVAQPAPAQELSFEQQFSNALNQEAPTQLQSVSQPFNPNYTGTGDIILNLDQPKKKSNVKLFAILGGIILIAIVAVLAIMMLGGNNKTSQSKTITPAAYANYILYGIESDEVISVDIEDIEDIEYVKKIGTQGMKKMDDVNFLYSIKEKIDAISTEINNEKMESVERSKEYLDILIKYKENNEITANLINKIKDAEYDFGLVEKTIKNNLEELIANFDNESLKQLLSDKRDYAIESIKNYEIMFDNGCFDNNKIDYECVDELNQAELDMYNQHIENKNEIYAKINDSLNMIKTNLIKEALVIQG